jgi:hypothetical protein
MDKLALWLCKLAHLKFQLGLEKKYPAVNMAMGARRFPFQKK